MAILGISSATKVISVGLVDKDQILAELTISGREAFSEDLIVYIKKIIDESRAKLTGVAVVEGPGSYSGLRGGLATAKSLAQVLKLKLVGVSTLEAIAYNFIACETLIVAITHAKRDEFNFALFGAKEHKLTRLTADLVITEDKLSKTLKQIKGEIIITGEVDKLKLKNALPSFPKGSCVAQIGQALIKAGHKQDPLKMTPNYSHSPNIREYGTKAHKGP